MVNFKHIVLRMAIVPLSALAVFAFFYVIYDGDGFSVFGGIVIFWPLVLLLYALLLLAECYWLYKKRQRNSLVFNALFASLLLFFTVYVMDEYVFGIF